MQILKRINSEIERRRKAGEDLPPAPKTAIAGPEYFGLCQPDVGCPGGYDCPCIACSTDRQDWGCKQACCSCWQWARLHS